MALDIVNYLVSNPFLYMAVAFLVGGTFGLLIRKVIR